MDKNKKQGNKEFDFECNSTDNEKDLKKDGTKTQTATDVYYKTQCKLPESEVAIPTYDSVIEAKEWVDEMNKK